MLKIMPGFSGYQKGRGFTLIELLVAISIMAIISAIGFVSYGQSQVIARDAKRKADLRAIQTALELYYQANKRFPCSGAAYQYSSNASWLYDAPGCTASTSLGLAPTYINRVPVDPKSNDSPPWGTGYGMAYQSSGTFGEGAYICNEGQWYILFVRLENSQDPDALGTKTIPLCGSTSIQAPAYPADSYYVTAP